MTEQHTQPMTALDGVDFPMIRLWCNMMGSLDYYVRDEIQRATNLGLDWRTTYVGTTANTPGSLETVTNLHTLFQLRCAAENRGWKDTAEQIRHREGEMVEKLQKDKAAGFGRGPGR